MTKNHDPKAKGIFMSALLAASHKMYTRACRRRILKGHDCFYEIFLDLQDFGRAGGML